MARGNAALLAAAVTLLAVLGGASCGQGTIQLPDTPPSIAGTITSVEPAGERIGSLRIEADPAQSTGSDKAVVTVLQNTQLVDAAGKRIAFHEFAMGRKVRAWYLGPVRESYPVQADAGIIILEPADKP